MAKITKLDDHRKGEKLAAHLALGAAEPSEVSGACLTMEQLADVATGYCSAEERKAALAHFSSCQQCYNAWLAVSLSLAAIENGSTRKKRSLGSIRILAYLGSAFAIAASVVVFLNVRDISLEKGMAPVSKNRAKIMQQMVPEKAEESSARQKTRSGRTTGGSPAPAAPRMKIEDQSTVPSVKMKAEISRGPAKERIPTVTSESEMAEPAPSSAGVVADSVEQDGGRSLTEWFSSVEAACRNLSDQKSAQWWGDLREQGQVILEGEANHVQQERLAAILEAMPAGDNSAAQAGAACRRVLQRLAEDPDNE